MLGNPGTMGEEGVEDKVSEEKDLGEVIVDEIRFRKWVYSALKQPTRDFRFWE